MRVGTTTPLSADIRLIAATNRNPEAAMADGKLREDLYHRLNVFPIAMPPLRDRATDIELLAQHFLDVLNKQESASKSFAPAAIAALYAHGWPGNVRELKNYVQRAFILADDVIDAHLAPSSVSSSESAPLLTVRVGTTLDEISRRLIEATLAECGSKRKAADMLGISLKTLYNRLAAYKAEDGGAAANDEQAHEEAQEHAYEARR
jgi:DNA-binding NtrC family response regulator